ncbi:MAG: ParB family transcriptional regulator, chromosome partitioning protein [Actinomycetota bacterium]|nr:ParB family transcriptional regulator, chromosome partitioning protein [Actinomycetota bacterium]MEA2843984.1 ParB family transcriptional regulator, chromosome partitioning protein [Actinomycetota bacterium]
MARRSGLGKGLGALIPAGTVDIGGSAFQELPIASITPNGRQPRSSFDEEAMAALTASVRELGVLQPVLVREAGEGAYELIAGERRWRAAKRAGLPLVPAIIRTVDDTASLEQALVENLQREDLNPLDEAAAYQQLLEDFHLTHDELAARMGKSRAAISNTLRLFQLPPSVQRLVADGKIAAGHARALLTCPDRAYQESLARRVVEEGMSVRAVEDEARRHNQQAAAASPPPQGPGRRLRPPGLLELEDLLSTHLDTRVKVEMGANRGRVVVDFATLEDLERIYRAMTGKVPVS